MRSTGWLTFALLTTGPAAFAAAPNPPPAAVPAAPGADGALPADAPLDTVLDALDHVGKSLKDLTANVSLTRTDPALGSEKTRAGKVWLQRRSDDDVRLHVVFDKLQEGRLLRDDAKQEYLLDGDWLTDRDYRIKSQVRRQVLKPGQKMNVMKLGEGPFPLPIGQDKAEVHHLFDVSMGKTSPDDVPPPPNTIHIVLKPKADTRLARRFSQIDVFVDRVSRMPVRVDTTDPHQTETQRTELRQIKLNTPGGLTEADFTLPDVDLSDWSTRTEALEQ